MASSPAENQAIDDLLAECCAQLFDECGLPVQPLTRLAFPSPEELEVGSLMGFGGEQMSGELVLAATSQPLERTYPGDQPSQRDWICELANQLVGRIKNQLLARKVEILLATPTALRGEDVCPAPERLRSPQVFAAQGGGFVCAWIDCQLAEGFELPAGPVSGAPTPLLEGELLLF